MKNFMRLISFSILCSVATIALANSAVVTVNNFHDIQKLLVQQKHPHDVLLALDDDNTLTMMPCPSPSRCQYLGGPAWYTWQSKLPSSSQYRVWKSFSQLLSINNLIFNMSKMKLDDDAIPATLTTGHHLGIHIVVASARGYDMLGATEKQFNQDGILKLIEQSAIKTPTKHLSYPGFYFPKPWNKKPVRAIAYVHGVLYLAGQNKGVMLQQFLAKTHYKHRIHIIIFVDDTMKNVKQVAKAYATDPSVYAICIHYTKLAKHKANFLTGKDAKKLQRQANNQWVAIRNAMNTNLADANF